MGRQRLEAFSDGVFAIIITIMVLEIKVPHGADLSDLIGVLPHFYAYALSFVFVGIYWNNHHHMLHTVTRTNGGILWANLFLLFWISLFPFGCAWLDESHFASLPTAVYAFMLMMAAMSYSLLQCVIISSHGKGSVLATALGTDFKGKISVVAYIASVGLAFYMPWISQVILIAVAILWLVPDRRIEKVVEPE